MLQTDKDTIATVETVDSDRRVETGAQDLRVVLGELQAGDALAVRALKLAEALAGADLPDADLAGLGAGGEHLGVAAEGHREYGVLHHHEVVLGLVFQIFSDFAGGKVPDLK